MENFKITRPAETNARRSPLLPSKIHLSGRSYFLAGNKRRASLDICGSFARRFAAALLNSVHKAEGFACLDIEEEEKWEKSEERSEVKELRGKCSAHGEMLKDSERLREGCFAAAKRNKSKDFGATYTLDLRSDKWN